MNAKPLRFRDVEVGQGFDFIEPNGSNTFFDRCYRTGPRTYRAVSSGSTFTVGSIDARVYHVGLVNSERAELRRKFDQYD